MLFGDPKSRVPVQLPCFRLYAKSTDYFWELYLGFYIQMLSETFVACLQLSYDTVISFFWCYGERSGNEIRKWASCSVDQLVKTVSFMRDGME